MFSYKEQIEKNKIISFVPSGNSMWPFLKNKNQSVIVKAKDEKLKPLDVAFYLRENGQPVLHRVISVKENSYIIRGDSQLYEEVVNDENVFGVLLGFYKGKKYIVCSDAKYIKRVQRWTSSKRYRPIVLKFFYRWLSIKRKVKKLFKVEGK